MNAIEKARQLLAKESPELRRAVGELVSSAMQATSFKYAAEIDYWQFARELIEDKAANNGTCT